MSEQISFLPIEDLTPQYVLQAFEAGDIEDWGLAMTGVPDAHKFTKGAGITVAVLDTGGPNHRDLMPNLLPAINVTSSATPDDRQGHGSHCAGIIAAAANGFGVLGVAPEAKILPIKVLDDSGRSGYETIVAGVRAAMEAGVDIINMSLGAPVTPPPALHQVIKEATARGIIVVAAAGNDSGAVNWPARYDEVIAVAAIDRAGNLANFSSRGDEITITAPGVGIYSTHLNQQYALLNGTSQAAPFIAGVCALILSWVRAHPELPQIGGVRDILSRLDDLADPAGRVGFIGKEGHIGFGIPRFANITDWESK